MSRIMNLGSKSFSGITRLTPEERFRTQKVALHQQLIAAMNLSVVAKMSEDDLRLEVRRLAEDLCRSSPDLLSLGERDRMVNEVINEAFGLGPLESLMRDPTVSDILINGPKAVFVERNGRLELTNIVF